MHEREKKTRDLAGIRTQVSQTLVECSYQVSYPQLLHIRAENDVYKVQRHSRHDTVTA